MIETILQFWPILIAFVSFIVWLIRLEGKIKIIEKEQYNAINQINKNLERLNDGQNEMKKDIHQVQISVTEIVAFEKGRSSSSIHSTNRKKSSG